MATLQERWDDDDAGGAWKALPASQCMNCAHKRRLGCAAFLDGIPAELFDNRVMHTSPYPGDHGILFERAASAKAFSPAVSEEIETLRPWRKADLKKWEGDMGSTFADFEGKTRARVRALIEDGTISEEPAE